METRQRFIENVLFEGGRDKDIRKEESEVLDTDRFKQDLNLDSLDHIEMVISAEQEFDIIIRDEDVDKLQTVGEMVKYIDGKLG